MIHLSAIRTQGKVRIAYLDSKVYADEKLIPIVVCPGLSETAEEYLEFMEFMLPRRTIVLSFRGRGLSDTPVQGYNLSDHVIDLEHVIEDAQLGEIHLMAFSRGVSYALGYARENSDRIKSLMLLDYPLEHRSMEEGWVHEYIEQYLKPTKRIEQIRAEAVIGIQRDSTDEELTIAFHKPVLLIHGALEGSLITTPYLQQYKDHFHQLEIVRLEKSGHNIRNTEGAKVNQSIKEFVEKH